MDKGTESNHELSLNEMGTVSGGIWHTVNTGIVGRDAAMRAEARKSSKQIDHIPNGTLVDTISDQLVWDPVEKRHFVQISYNGKTGWVASSLVGLKR